MYEEVLVPISFNSKLRMPPGRTMDQISKIFCQVVRGIKLGKIKQIIL